MTGKTSNSEQIVADAANFLKTFLTDKSIDSDIRRIIGKVIKEELKLIGHSNPTGIRKTVYDVIDAVARYNATNTDNKSIIKD